MHAEMLEHDLLMCLRAQGCCVALVAGRLTAPRCQNHALHLTCRAIVLVSLRARINVLLCTMVLLHPTGTSSTGSKCHSGANFEPDAANTEQACLRIAHCNKRHFVTFADTATVGSL